MGHCYVHFAFVFTLRALERINVLTKVTRKRFIFRPSSINNSSYKINFSLDLAEPGHSISSAGVRKSC